MKLELVEFLEKGESYISGDEMLKRAKKLGITSGRKEADYLLEHQEEIPEEFKKYYLIFPEYTKGVGDRDRHVAYFDWYGGRWVLRFRWVGDYFSDRARFVRPREYSDPLTPGASGSLEARILALEDFKNKVEKILKLEDRI